MPSSCCDSPTKVVGDIAKHYICESCGQVYDEVSEKEWWWKYVSILGELEYIGLDEALPKLIAEANRRRDQEWREKLENIKEKSPYSFSIWNSALDEAKKLFTHQEARKEKV